MDIQTTLLCDVLVIGSGMSGCCAAIQAGRLGCNTILLEKDEVLGGNSGPNLGVEIRGAHWYNPYGAETGIVHELEEKQAALLAETPVKGMLYNISRRREAIIQEAMQDAGVRILKRHYARIPEMDGDRIDAVIAEDIAAFKTVRIKVKSSVIDASGDGHIAALSGADFDYGAESRDEFNESSAPEKRHDMIQGTSLVAIAYKTEHDIPFIPPAGTPPYEPRTWEDSFSYYANRMRNGIGKFPADDPAGTLRFIYFTEAGGDMDTITDEGAIYEKLLKQVWAFWNHFKNGPEKELAANWDLLWVSPKSGKRESRRFMGDYILTQTDLEDGRRFEDDIAFGGHNMDDHRTYGEQRSIYTHSVPPIYGIPYRCCYSRNIANLFIGGRLISATHLAHSSERTMRTGGAIGQGIGVAAALMLKYECTPRDIYTEHLSELIRELLKVDGSILNRKLEDETDLAPQAKITASSEYSFNGLTPDFTVPMFCPAGNVLREWPEKLDAIELFLKNDSDSELDAAIKILRYSPERKWLHVHEYNKFGRNDPQGKSFKPLHEHQFKVPGNFNGWLKIDFDSPVIAGTIDPCDESDRLIISLESSVKLRWGIAREPCETAQAVEYSSHEDLWKPLAQTGALRVHPEPETGKVCNLINGHTRRYSSGPANMWCSAPEQSPPHELIFEWDDAKEFSKVELIFDNLEKDVDENPWRCGKRVSDKLVKSYQLEVKDGDSWEKIIEVTDNINRFRTHEFTPVKTSAVKLLINEINGSGIQARIYQVRIYS